MRIPDNNPGLNRQQPIKEMADSINVQTKESALPDQSTANQKAAVDSTVNTSHGLPDDTAHRITLTLGIEPTPENIQFIERQGFSTAKTFAKLVEILLMTDNPQVLEELGTSLLTLEDLPQYLRGFDDKSLGVILERLNAAIEKALPTLDKQQSIFDKAFSTPGNQLPGLEKVSSALEFKHSAAKELIQIFNDLTKGLAIQMQHPFPFSFIPFVIVDDGKPQAGEAWVKRDGQCIYLWLDTDNLGSISVYIKDSEKGLGIEFTGSYDTVALLRNNKAKLIKALQNRQIKLHTLTFKSYGDGDKPVSILARHLSIKLPINLGV